MNETSIEWYEESLENARITRDALTNYLRLIIGDKNVTTEHVIRVADLIKTQKLYIDYCERQIKELKGEYKMFNEKT